MREEPVDVPHELYVPELEVALYSVYDVAPEDSAHVTMIDVEDAAEALIVEGAVGVVELVGSVLDQVPVTLPLEVPVGVNQPSPVRERSTV